MMFWCEDLAIWWDDVMMWRCDACVVRTDANRCRVNTSAKARDFAAFELYPVSSQTLFSFKNFLLLADLYFFFFREVSESGKLPIPLARCVAGLLPFSFILLTSESACGAKNSANVSRQRKMFLNCNQPLFPSESHFRKSFESSFSFSLGAEFPNKDLRSNCFRFRSKGHRLYWA